MQRSRKPPVRRTGLRSRRPVVPPEVPTAAQDAGTPPDTAHATERSPASSLDDAANEAVRRMVEAAYT